MVVQLGEGDTGVGGAVKQTRRPAAWSASDAEPVGSSGLWTQCSSRSEAAGRCGGTHDSTVNADSYDGGSFGGLRSGTSAV
jgi:hypothetical protein